MLNNICEVAGEAELFCHLICKGGGEVIVQPTVVEVSGCYLRAIGGGSTEMIVGESSHIVACRVLHCGILTLDGLPFEAGTVIHVQFL